MISSALGSEESLTYADHLLAPLYKVSEGLAGKVVSGMNICLLFFPSDLFIQHLEVAHVQCLDPRACHMSELI